MRSVVRAILRPPAGPIVLLTLLWAAPARAQLISPGKLSAVHADVEGIRKCTQCHVLRKPGISPELCLACHGILETRISAGRGFHASLTEPDCASCHKEHFGLDFALVRLDTLSFDHARTGYGLEGRHAEQGCRDCHVPERIADPDVVRYASEHASIDRTFLGLSTECASCHDDDSPHGTQFRGQACTDCHDVNGWEGAGGFDHDRTSFTLSGRHRQVECAGCHVPVARPDGSTEARYEGVRAERCTDCHQDEHGGAMPGRCESCHDTGGWQRVNRSRVESTFDHTTTGFLLEGSHASAPCAACHGAQPTDPEAAVRIRFVRGTERKAFPRPELADGSCLACHRDPHGQVFEDRDDGGDCRACHGQSAWLPADFDAERHDRETGFVLEGAHRVVACVTCHGVSAGAAPDFRLDGSATCASCHASANPHGAQFADRGCEDCHTVEGFTIASFDHTRTRYALDGAHADAPCASCHVGEADASGVLVVRYRPLGTECRDCHGGTK